MDIELLKRSPLFNLSLGSKELFHSNFLAWLGNNYSTRQFFKAVIDEITKNSIKWPGRWFVEREDHNFDLCIKDDNNNYLLVIENKVKSIPVLKQLMVYAGLWHAQNKKSKPKANKYLLLTLVGHFPHQPQIQQQGVWEIVTYDSLALVMRMHLSKVTDLYHLSIIHDYIHFIEILSRLAQSWTLQLNAPFCLVNNSNKVVDNKLQDLKEKIRFSQIYIELLNRLKTANINNVEWIDDYDTTPAPALNSNKAYIFVGWGFTRTSGLIDIAIPINNTLKPTLQRGVIKPNVVIKIQIQGNSYRHVLENFNASNKTILKQHAMSNFYIHQLQFFSEYNKNRKIINYADFGNTYLFENQFYPNTPVTLWPYNSFSGNKGLFLYQSRNIKKTATTAEVLDNLVVEIKKILNNL